MNKNLLYILTIVAALGFTSCDKYLDTTPDNRMELDSEEKVKELLTSAYPEFTYGLFCFAMSDNADDKGPGHQSMINNEQGYFWEEFSDVNQDSPAGYWDKCYSAISHANKALEFIESQKVGGEIPNSYLPYYGEALVIRAYCHFMLVNLWGNPYNPATAASDLGVPYVTEVETVVFKDYKRETVAKVYELIEKDLVEGLQYIDDSAYDVPKYHFNKAAANTFASRFYLYKGEWQKVVDYSTDALGSNASSYLRNLSGKYKNMGLNEQITEYTKSTEPANFMLTSNVTYWFYYFQAVLQYGYTSNVSEQGIKQKLFDNIFNLTGNNEWCQATASFGEGDDFILKWGYFFKRMDVNSDIGWYYAMTPKIVAEEALFNRIEANVMLKKYTEAEQDLDSYFEKRMTNYADENKVTEANITAAYQDDSNADSPLNPWYDFDDKQRTYLNCVIDTRRREFYYNGMRWFDIRRFNLKVVHKVKNGTPVILEANDARKALQIPVSAQQYGLQSNAR
ncbi:RagB/SusD family nutrient uptake outer membrane protein [Marinifilum breve]|nr:RagB/SusD family nutrient uptake outer membrane protein [Marinifilum breve]